MSASAGPGLGSSRRAANPGGACRRCASCGVAGAAAGGLGSASGSVWPPLQPSPALAAAGFAAALRLPGLTSCQDSSSGAAGGGDKAWAPRSVCCPGLGMLKPPFSG